MQMTQEMLMDSDIGKHYLENAINMQIVAAIKYLATLRHIKYQWLLRSRKLQCSDTYPLL